MAEKNSAVENREAVAEVMALVMGPIDEARERITELAECLSPTMYPVAAKLFEEFIQEARARLRALDMAGLRAVCEEIVSQFARLGN
jgi:hypothetical protein